MTKLTDSETLKRNYLKKNKPRVYEKIQKFDEKIKRGESIAIIQMQYKYACNLKCEHCAILPMQEKRGRKSLTPDDVVKIAQQADELGLARFVITGGEPLIFSDLDDVVAAIDPRRFYINMDSNGWFLDYEKALHLKKIGIDRIQLSIDSYYSEEHDVFRGMAGSHERAMKAVDATINAGLQIFIQTVVTHSRLHSEEFIKFIEYFNKKGIMVFVTYAKPVGAWEGNFNDIVTREDMLWFENVLEKKYQVCTHLTSAYGLNMGCIAVKGMFSITEYGDVLPCPYMQISLGNIFNEPLKDIITRGFSINSFGELQDTCLIAEDIEFIKGKIAKKIYGKPTPVPCAEVFDKDDTTKRPFYLDLS
jgi:MoaA/NifB/PqqE/SkfB family radical SAM enzyme